MSAFGQGRKVSPLESIGAHLLLIAAVAFALYPVLWVISTAFSASADPVPRVLPLPVDPTLEHLRGVAFSTLKVPGEPDRWLFGLQFLNSIVISLATALYRDLAKGGTIGNALNDARAAVCALPSADWANYLHYGSFDFSLKKPGK